MGFHLLENSHKLYQGKGIENIFYFFHKITILRLNREEDDTRSFISFTDETVNFYNLEAANRVAHVIFDS